MFFQFFVNIKVYNKFYVNFVQETSSKSQFKEHFGQQCDIYFTFFKAKLLFSISNVLLTYLLYVRIFFGIYLLYISSDFPLRKKNI